MTHRLPTGLCYSAGMKFTRTGAPQPAQIMRAVGRDSKKVLEKVPDKYVAAEDTSSAVLSYAPALICAVFCRTSRKLPRS